MKGFNNPNRLIPLCVVLSTPLLSSCVGTIVSGTCALNTNEKDMSTKHYEYQVRFTTANGDISKTGSLECTPTEYLCGGGNWYAKFPKQAANPIEIKVDNDRSLDFYPPECESYSKLKNTYQEVTYPKSSNPKLHAYGDSYSLHLDDLRRQSALQLYGVRLESLTMRKLATE